MTIHVDLKNQAKMMYLVELLRSLDFVERVSIQEDVEKTVEKPLSFFEKYNGSFSKKADEVHTIETSEGLSSKYWGAWKTNPLSIEKIDYEIRKMREEWDRDIY
jgi:hypothetical protein